MNVPLNPDSTHYASPEAATAGSGYSPSVPISVYRELAVELKTTQATVETLTRQNQQLVRQNKLLRDEIQRFVQSAQQLGHFAGVMPSETLPNPSEHPGRSPLPQPSLNERPMARTGELPTTTLGPEVVVPKEAAIVPSERRERRERRPDSPQPMVESLKQRLFTEEPERPRSLSKGGPRPDLGTLWLVTTILLVIVTAFGAGFLIMRPLLKR